MQATGVYRGKNLPWLSLLSGNRQVVAISCAFFPDAGKVRVLDAELFKRQVPFYAFSIPAPADVTRRHLLLSTQMVSLSPNKTFEAIA